jgi:hypothetical protein
MRLQTINCRFLKLIILLLYEILLLLDLKTQYKYLFFIQVEFGINTKIFYVIARDNQTLSLLSMGYRESIY